MLKVLEYIKNIENKIIFNIKHLCFVNIHKGFGNCLIITTNVYIFNKEDKNFSFEKIYSEEDLNKTPTDLIINFYIEEASKELIKKIKN